MSPAVPNYKQKSVAASRPSPLVTVRMPTMSAPSTPPPLPVAKPLRFAPFLPLAMAVVEGPWLGAMLILWLYLHGSAGPTDRQMAVCDVIAIVPAVVGLASAIYAVARRQVHGLLWLAWSLGVAGCLFVVAIFGHEFFVIVVTGR